MRCPKCRCEETRVRQTKDSVRRRSCVECGHEFVTHEGLDVKQLWVRKRDETTVGFSQKRLAESIEKAAVSRLERSEVADLITQVIEDLYAEVEFFPDPDAAKRWLADAEITTLQIGESVMRVLDANPRYKATRLRYALLFGRSNGSFADASSFLTWIEKDQQLRRRKLPATPERVVKRDERSYEFDPAKLRNSVKFAVRKRPVDETTAPGSRKTNDELIDTIYLLILRRLRGQKLVTTGQIAAATLRVLLADESPELAKLMTPGDRQLAYLRVASSAKRFTRAEDFQAEALLLLARDKDVVPTGFEGAPDEKVAVASRRRAQGSASLPEQTGRARRTGKSPKT